MEVSIKIRKVKLAKDRTVEITYDQIIPGNNGPVINKLIQKDAHRCHNDLVDAMANLDDHLRDICEQPSESQVKTTGFVIGGDEGEEGVTLIGRRTLSDARVLNLVSPFTNYTGEEDPNEKLRTDLELAIDEVEQYLSGKHAPDEQMSLESEAAFYGEEEPVEQQ